MRHKPSSAVLILYKYVDDFCTKYPDHSQAIDAFLRPYRLPDGSLQNDDNIMLGLRDLAKAWRRRKPPLSHRGSRR